MSFIRYIDCNYCLINIFILSPEPFDQSIGQMNKGNPESTAKAIRYDFFFLKAMKRSKDFGIQMNYQCMARLTIRVDKILQLCHRLAVLKEYKWTMKTHKIPPFVELHYLGAKI